MQQTPGPQRHFEGTAPALTQADDWYRRDVTATLTAPSSQATGIA